MPQFNEGNINSYLVPSGSLTGSLSNSGTLTGQIAIGSGGGTTDYNDLTNKPQINSVTLSGNKTTADLNISYNDLDDKPTIPAAQVNSDWNASSGVAEILNKPTIPTSLADLSDVDIGSAPTMNYTWLMYNVGHSKWEPRVYEPYIDNLLNVRIDSTLTDGQSIVYNQVSNKWINAKYDYDNLNNKPTLATVATSGDYDDLTNKPTIPAAQVNSDWNAASGVAEILNKPALATVATSGSYNDLTDTPIPAYENKGTINDLNNVALDNGGSYKYIFNAGASNKPASGGGTLLHMWNSGNHAWGCQIVFSDTGMYFRGINNSVFGTWKTIVTT